MVGLGQQQGDAEGAPAGGSQGQSHGGAPGLAARAVIEPVANAAWVDQIKVGGWCKGVACTGAGPGTQQARRVLDRAAPPRVCPRRAQASYVPLQLSERLHIVPEHCQPTDPAALNVVLQPGVAFGTGEPRTHARTPPPPPPPPRALGYTARTAAFAR